MSDITSGMNICENIYLDERFNVLCGFTESELCDILRRIVEKCGLPGSALDDALRMMNTWYNGYMFSPDAAERVYNPTLAFHFVKYFGEKCRYPRQILDSNLAVDQGKLEYLGQALAGQQDEDLKLKGYVVVSTGFERLIGEEVELGSEPK